MTGLAEAEAALRAAGFDGVERDGDVIHARAEVGDHLQLFAGAVDQVCVNEVGDGGRQDLGPLNRRLQRRPVHRLVLKVQLGVEQFAHPRFDRVRQASG